MGFTPANPTLERRRNVIAELPSELQGCLQEIEILRDLPTGAMLFQQGDEPASIFIIRSGQVKLTAGSNGRSLHLGICLPGEILGVAEALAQQPHPYNAVVTIGGKVGRISADKFSQFLQEQKGACLHIVRLLCDDVGAAYRQMRNLGGM